MRLRLRGLVTPLGTHTMKKIYFKMQPRKLIVYNIRARTKTRIKNVVYLLFSSFILNYHTLNVIFNFYHLNINFI